MNEKILLVWVIGKIILELFRRPEKAEALKQKLIEAGDEKAVKDAIIGVSTELLAETVGAELPQELLDGLVLAADGKEVEDVLSEPAIKKGAFDFIGEIISRKWQLAITRE